MDEIIQKLLSKMSEQDDLLYNIPEISLEEDNFIINAGERINLSWRIDIGDIQGEIAVNAKLRYELIDPESDETLLRVDYPLSEEKLPYRFNHTLVIPDDIDHDFLVGELILETQRGYHLTHASFTITTHHYYPVNCTIELMDTQTKDSYTFDLELAEKINSRKHYIFLLLIIVLFYLIYNWYE